MSDLTVERVIGEQVEPYLDDLAALRIEVFREFPYLYEGTLENESRYLRGYASSPRSLVVLAREGARVVGASTAMPLMEHGDAAATPALEAAGFDPKRVYYFAESVLRASFRGRGLGHAFFDAREAHARELGFAVATFCAVVRPNDHPLRPADYVPHDVFWRKRGYVQRPDIRAEFSWRDVGDAVATPKSMIFWVKELS
ncbi:MAG: GNAT family N-acetyltransferase [Polyangiales bacterium]